MKFFNIMRGFGVLGFWDYWYDLDTCVRESVGDIFESKLEE